MVMRLFDRRGRTSRRTSCCYASKIYCEVVSILAGREKGAGEVCVTLGGIGAYDPVFPEPEHP